MNQYSLDELVADTFPIPRRRRVSINTRERDVRLFTGGGLVALGLGLILGGLLLHVLLAVVVGFALLIVSGALLCPLILGESGLVIWYTGGDPLVAVVNRRPQPSMPDVDLAEETRG